MTDATTPQPQYTWQRSRPEGWCSGYDPKIKDCKRGTECLCRVREKKQ